MGFRSVDGRRRSRPPWCCTRRCPAPSCAPSGRFHLLNEPITPVAKPGPVRLGSGRVDGSRPEVVRETRKIERLCSDPGSRSDGVEGVAPLLEVTLNRDDLHGLAEVHGFGDGLEPRRRYKTAAARHHRKKFAAVQLMEGERIVVVFDRRRTGPVPEAVKPDIGMRFMPLDDLLRVAAIDEVDKVKRLRAAEGLLKQLVAQ